MSYKFWILIWTFCLAVSTPTHNTHALVMENRSACGESKAPGLCRGRQLRYAYNKLTDNCESFYYTGCASTANNFLTYEECRRDCMRKLRY